MLVWQEDNFFDGYSDVTSNRNMKSAEQLRRATKRSAPNVPFNESTSVTTEKDLLLSNKQNKQRLISLQAEQFQSERFNVKQASEDTDSLIVTTAVDLVMHSHFSPTVPNIFLLKSGRGRQGDVIYSHLDFKLSQTL